MEKTTTMKQTQTQPMTENFRDELIKNFIEVKIDPSKFLIITETLTRIGIYSRKNRTLYQTCHLLHKKGKYYIVHFKELFMLDNKLRRPMTRTDYRRRNYIAKLLESWGLVEIVNRDLVEESGRNLKISVIPYSKKGVIHTESKYIMLSVKNQNAQDDEDEYYDDEDEYYDDEEYYDEDDEENYKKEN